MNIDLAATGLNPASFPAQPWLVDIPTILDTTVYQGAVTLAGQQYVWYRFDYKTPWRMKRGFIVFRNPFGANTIPLLSVHLHGSDGTGYGAWDLVGNPTSIQDQWPLRFLGSQAAGFDSIALCLDGPNTGLYTPDSYTPADPYQPLVEDICGVIAGRHVINNLPGFHTWNVALKPLLQSMALVGFSAGAVRAQFLAAAVPDFSLVYIASGQMDKSYDTSAWTSPTDWAAGFNYEDLAKNSKAARYRYAFGGDVANGDYLAGNVARASYSLPAFSAPLPLAHCQALVAFDAAKFSYNFNNALNHQTDEADINAWLRPKMLWQVPRGW